MNMERNVSFARSIIIFFILLFVYSKFGPSLPISILSQSKGEPFIVSDTGKVTVVPDIAKLTLGIEEQGQSLKKIQESVNTKSKGLTDSLKKLGIDEKDIKTSSYNVYPEYDYQVSPYKITGYKVSINYEVKITDFENVNDAITISTENGANIIGNIAFEVNEKTKLESTNKAREEAVKLAKEKATGLAKAAGITLGKVINVSESSGLDYPRPIAMYDKAVGMGSGGEATPSNINPGQTEISVTVSLSFEIR